MQQRRLLIGDGLWVAGGRATAALSGLILSVLLSRILAPPELGRYFTLLSIIIPASILAKLGLDTIAVRNVALTMAGSETARARQVVCETVSYGGMGIAFVGMALFLVGCVLGLEPVTAAIMAIWMGLLAAQGLLIEILRGFRDIRAAAVLGETLTNVVNVIVLIAVLALAWHLALGQLLAVMLIGLVVSVLLSLGAVRRKLLHLPNGHAKRLNLLAQAWPILINNVVWLVFGQIDIWILSAFRPPTEVAIYGIASRLAGVLGQPQLITRLVMLPRLTALHIRHQTPELERMVRRAATLSGVLAIIGACGYMFGGEWILAGLFGETYRGAVAILLILALGQIVSACTGLSATTLIMTGHAQVVMVYSLVCSMLTAGGAVWLASAYGALGVAAAVAAGMAVQNIAMMLVVRQRLGIWTFFDPYELESIRP